MNDHKRTRVRVCRLCWILAVLVVGVFSPSMALAGSIQADDMEFNTAHVSAGSSVQGLPADKDIRIGYQLVPSGYWENIDSLKLVLDGIVVYHKQSPKSCDTDGLLKMLVHRKRPAIDGVLRYDLVPTTTTLELSSAARYQTLPLDVLNQLPTGYIFSIRLRVREVIVTSLGHEHPLTVPTRWRSLGIPLAINQRFAPVCNDFNTSLVVQFSSSMFRSGPAGPELVEGTFLRTELTAPAPITPSIGGYLEVPSEAWVNVPHRAIKKPILLRLDRVSAAKLSLEDRVFARIQRPVGRMFDFKPDVQRFQVPIEVAMDIPHNYEVTRKTINNLRDKGAPPVLLSRLSNLIGREVTGEKAFIELLRNTIGTSSSYLYLVLKESRKSLAFDSKRLALYTYTPKYGIWSPDVPKLLPKHQEMVIAELDRVIAAKEASSNLEDHFPPDFSFIPASTYDELDIDEINNSVQSGYLVTGTNHFCVKSLFADLSGATGEFYQPLLDGALDDLCQNDGIGWAVDSNDDVHCGHNLPSAADFRQANRKTRRIIDKKGVALRFRDNVRNYFADLGVDCSALSTPAHCYDINEFEDDIRWAVEMWREAINRNPDGSYTDRFHINCWEIAEASAGEYCNGDEIDVGIRDTTKWAYTTGKNVTLSEALLNGARANLDGRVELRHTILHEFGHVVGLHHWAAPGTLMSYTGRHRNNTNRENTCAPYTRAEVGSQPSNCNVEESGNQAGTKPVNRFRLARLTSADVHRIRDQINDGAEWSMCEHLQCELLTEKTEYAALELPEYDSGSNEYYYVMDFDLAFAHCGDLSAFDRLELEILSIDADNALSDVLNLYNETLEFTPLAMDAAGNYWISVRLESRKLINANPTVNFGVTSFPSFTEYVQGNNALAARYPNLAMVLRAYKDTDGSGVRGEFIAAATGLLRSPILDPIAAPISLGMSDVTQAGVSIATDPLLDTFEDYVTTPDLFPHIDNALRKPNVGRAMYITVPPRGDSYLTDPTANFEITFQWNVPAEQFSCGPLGPARLWVDSIEITREYVPVIQDWGAAGGPLNVTPVQMLQYTGDPTVAQDTCLQSSGSFTLPALSDTPLRTVTLPDGSEIEAWEMYHIAVRFDFIHYVDPLTNLACADPDVCDPTSACVATTPLAGTRVENYYVSIAGPTGAITKPLGIDSLCLIQAPRSGEKYEVAANVTSLTLMPDFFPDYEFQVKLVGYGKAAGHARITTYAGEWTDVTDVPADGTIRLSPTWNNSKNDHDYKVKLRYRYRKIGATEWMPHVELDRLYLRIDEANDCDQGARTYDETCSLSDSDYPCIPGI